MREEITYVNDHVGFSRRPADRHEAMVVAAGIPVWALVGYHRVVEDLETVARDYGLTVEQVQAALDYYDAHRPEIDSRLEENKRAWL